MRDRDREESRGVGRWRRHSHMRMLNNQVFFNVRNGHLELEIQNGYCENIWLLLKLLLRKSLKITENR